MLKHITNGAGGPGPGRVPPKVTACGIPSIESAFGAMALHSDSNPSPSPDQARAAPPPTTPRPPHKPSATFARLEDRLDGLGLNNSGEGGGPRPMSVHGSVFHNQSIYANTVHLPKMSNALSHSVPSQVVSGAGANTSLNTSSSNTSPANRSKTTASTSFMDSSGTSHHSLTQVNLNATNQISPIAARTGSSASSSRSTQPMTAPTAASRNLILSPAGRASNNINLNNSIVETRIPGTPARQPHNSTMFSPGNATANGGLNLTHNTVSKRLNTSTILPANVSKFMNMSKEAGVKEMITSLAVLCLVSLLLALLSLVFLLKISPVTAETAAKIRQYDSLTQDEFLVLYEVTLALCALTLSLNLCCLLVCAIQFLFAVKLVKSSHGKARTNKYLKEASLTRICAIGGFFISIPVFLTGIILYSFLHFDSTPAIITSVLIGLGIVFCGAAVVHNVFVWQKEKMHSFSLSGSPLRRRRNDAMDGGKDPDGTMNKSSKNHTYQGLPQATLDLSAGANNSTAKGLELSTLV